MGTDLRRAASWLAGHGAPDASPSPLIAARLRARRRSVLPFVAVLVVAAIVAVNGYSVWTGTQLGRFWLYLGIFLLAMLGQWLRLWALRVSDRRIGAALTRRVTHPGSSSWRAVLGPRRIALALATYGAAFAVGVLDLAYARTGTDRAILATFFAGLAALAVLGAAEIADVVRRPAVAEDALSLAVDDVLRTEDAHEIAVTMVPGMLAVFATIALTARPPLLFGLGLAMIGFSLVMFVWGQLLPKPSLRVDERAGVGR
jgi:hypothetical protein